MSIIIHLYSGEKIVFSEKWINFALSKPQISSPL